ncbi:hypothetical protein PVK06_011340 [Gossypium arboreum]|uniref:Uncharacterized protein n=1 Tax=Gossypium arboreum TaxID=29729 RepID=A0ABR0Q8R2_GOSAR|nr:hypothetical protein PVK06_011340 [Gossypium arboreum]
MEDRRKKGLCFWYRAKYRPNHKCMMSQLYQLLMEPLSENEGEEFQDCQEILESTNPKGEICTIPILSLHAMQVKKLNLLVDHQCKLKVSIADGGKLVTQGHCRDAAEMLQH